MTASSTLGDNPLFLVHYLMRVLRVVVLLAVWRTIMCTQQAVSGMTVGTLLTYTLAAEVFAEPLAGRTALPHELWDGRIAVRFLRPMSVFGQYMAESAGSWSVNFCVFSVPLLFISPLLGVDCLPVSVLNGLWFLLSLILAVAVGFAVDLIFGSLVVLFGNGEYSVNQMRMAVTSLLSGAVLPLAVYPWGIGQFFEWLPFASQASAPLRIYTGTCEPFRLILMQAGWAFVLWIAALRIWQRQRERLVTYGG